MAKPGEPNDTNADTNDEDGVDAAPDPPKRGVVDIGEARKQADPEKHARLAQLGNIIRKELEQRPE